MTELRNSLDPMGGQAFFMPSRSVAAEVPFLDGTREGIFFWVKG